MKKRIVLGLSLLFFVNVIDAADTINILEDYVLVSDPFPDHLYAPGEPLLFMNRQDEQTLANLLHYGLHFSNQALTYLPNDIRLREESDTTCTNFNVCEEPQWYDSPIIGVHGEGTHVVFQGKMKVDNSRADLALVLTDKGRFTVDSAAHIDMVFSRWGNFTRSIYVFSDGTGEIEFAEGFVADHSNYGMYPVGLGAVRLYNAIYTSHDERGLPYYYRPKMSDTHAKINSHLVVLEDGKQSVWQVKTNAQDFPGGLWLYEDFLVHTETDLSLSGQIDTFKYSEQYVNYGGLMFFTPHKTLTKEGGGKLILTGDQAYAEGASIHVKSGELVIASDPFMYGDTHFTNFKDFQNGQHLTVSLFDSATLSIEHKQVHLAFLSMQGEHAVLQMPFRSGGSCNRLILDTASLSGTLLLTIPDAVTLHVGDPYHLFDFTYVDGVFQSVRDKDNRYAWDTSALYTEGIIRVKQVNVGVQSSRVSSSQVVYPNPSEGIVYVGIPEGAARMDVFHVTGKNQASYDVGAFQLSDYRIQLSDPGLYTYVISDPVAILSQGKFLVVE